MKEVQLAYQFLKNEGITQKVIIRGLNMKGIKPPRSSEYSNQQLTRLVNENYIPNQNAVDEIIAMAVHMGYVGYVG
jgi:hypothetical protein